jgi:Zn-dependent protease
MKLNLGTYFGVPLYFHWSALLLYAAALPTWAFWTGDFWIAALAITALFGCVAAHEYGHVRAGQMLGYDTSAVYIWAAGGLASFDDVPSGTMKEFWISVAGPAVNVALAIAIFTMLFTVGADLPEEIGNPFSYGPTQAVFWALLGVWNLLMAGFNLLPMFPSDGGRILRSLLSQKISVKSATLFASALGVGAGVVLLTVAVASLNPVMGFVGIFLGGAAIAEYRDV